jgi:hypothetical protein
MILCHEKDVMHLVYLMQKIMHPTIREIILHLILSCHMKEMKDLIYILLDVDPNSTK